jgi:cobalt-zinc-cadmium efflux system membrane fusion protein
MMKDSTTAQTALRIDRPPRLAQVSDEAVDAPRRACGKPRLASLAFLLIAVLILAAAAVFWWPRWWHIVTAAVAPDAARVTDAHDEHGEQSADGDTLHKIPAEETRAGSPETPGGAPESHAGEDHPGHTADGSLELSEQAVKNVGLALFEVKLRDFHRSLTVPAVVVERPGRSEITVSAPMTGIVTRIHPICGEVVAPRDALFDLRLTDEDLVEKQSDLLRDLEQLDVINQEVNRLQEVARSGAVPGKRLLEPMYEKQKLEGAMRAQREALLLHGLTAEQIGTIERERQLIKSIVVYAPVPDESHKDATHADFFQVAELAVKRGEHVATGTPLMTLTDHCELYIEGRAFEQDVQVLNQAANKNMPVSALIESNGEAKPEVSDLRILYIDNNVDQESRALKFYVSLRNELLRDESTTDGHRFVAWRYKPGQRVELLVPVETWANRMVLPVDAVIPDGPDSYVYQKYANHFDRVAVHVEYRDQRGVVIASDGPLKPGDVVAAGGAYQLHLAIKNKSGGGVDPHAGHNH